MSKVKIIYECTKCHYEYRKWYGVCKECQSEGTITETKPIVNSGYNSSSFSMRPSEPLNIDFKDITNLTPLKRNSIFVIGGEPGIGKSTLVAQICLKVEYHKVLYCTGEESIDSVVERLERIKGAYQTGHIFVEYAIYIEQIQELLNRNNIDLLIIDSMHTLKSSEHTGVINICDMLRNVALKYNVAIILTSHITKDGILAGPKTIEHMVDVVFYMEGDRYGSMRTLRSVKNRFGSTSEYSMFEMTKDGLLSVNGQNRFVCKRERAVSGSILCPVIINGQIIVIEVQALVVKDSIPRVEVCGYNMNKVKMLIGVITKWCRINLQFNTIYINIIGGIKIDDSCVELAICVAIISSFLNISIPFNILFCGEISLTGDIFKHDNILRRSEAISNMKDYKLIANIDHSSIMRIKHLAQVPDILKKFEEK